MTESASKEVQLKTLPRQVFSETQAVTVIATIDQAMATWVIRGVTVKSDSPTVGTVQPETISVTVTGPKQLRGNFDAKDLSAVVGAIPDGKDADRLIPKIYGLPAQVVAKELEEVSVTRITPTPAPKVSAPKSAPTDKSTATAGKRITKQK